MKILQLKPAAPLGQAEQETWCDITNHNRTGHNRNVA